MEWLKLCKSQSHKEFGILKIKACLANINSNQNQIGATC